MNHLIYKLRVWYIKHLLAKGRRYVDIGGYYSDKAEFLIAKLKEDVENE